MRLAVSAADLWFALGFVAAVILAGALRKTARWVSAVTAALGCAGYVLFVDAHASEVQATVLVLLGGTFLLGAAVPARPWLWALIIGLAIPLKALIAALISPAIFDWKILVTLLFALAGGYGGALARRLAASL